MVSSVLLLYFEEKNLHKISFPPFCFLILKKRISVIHCFLSFSFWRAKKMNNEWFAPFCTIHCFFGFISFDTKLPAFPGFFFLKLKKKYVELMVSEIWFFIWGAESCKTNGFSFFLQIKERNLHKTSFPRFCVLTLKKRICVIHGFLRFCSLGAKKICITNDFFRFASWD